MKKLLVLLSAILFFSCTKEPTFVGTWERKEGIKTTLYYITNMVCIQEQSDTIKTWHCCNYMLQDDVVYIMFDDHEEKWNLTFSNDSLYVDAQSYQMILTRY